MTQGDLTHARIISETVVPAFGYRLFYLDYNIKSRIAPSGSSEYFPVIAWHIRVFERPNKSRFDAASTFHLVSPIVTDPLENDYILVRDDGSCELPGGGTYCDIATAIEASAS